MGLQIESGSGNGKLAKVNDDNFLITRSVIEKHAAQVSYDEGLAFTWTADDAAPSAGEYTLYLKNDSTTKKLVIDMLIFNSTDNDVVWKLHQVTGTAAGASVVTGTNLNLSSGQVADATARGGAGGVTGLTSSKVLGISFGGPGMTPIRVDLDGTVVLGQNNAIALEYDAGTGGRAAVTIGAHYHND
jgi:hypothetical protein